MSATQFLTDASTRHQVFLQRYAGGEAKKANKLLSRLRRDINARLSQEPSAFQTQRLTSLLGDINGLYATATKDIAATVARGAVELAESEAAFSVGLYKKVTKPSVVFNVPSQASLIAALDESVMAAPVGSGISIDDALRQFGDKKAAQVSQVISDGVILGDPTPQITAKVAGTMGTIQSRQLEALVRTVTNHASSVARLATYQENGHILEGYEWVSTLDSRTTLICAGRDGVVYTNVGVDPMPPAHWNCRSTTIPRVNPKFSKASGLGGTRASKGATGPARVNTKTTYGGWLKRQPKEFIDEALGVERSKLFRSGKLTIDKFTDPTGRVFTLKQLEAQIGVTTLEV